MATSIKTQCSTRPGRILGSRMCQKTFLVDEFDLIEAKCQDINEQINVKIYIENLDKNEVDVLTI